MLLAQNALVDIAKFSQAQRDDIELYFTKLLANRPKETQAAYQKDVKSYCEFLADNSPGVPAFCHDERQLRNNVTLYLDHLIKGQYKRTTIERRLSVIRLMYSVMKLPSPFESKVFSEFVKASLDNELEVTPPKQARPFLEAQLILANKRGYIDTLGLRNLTMLNVAFDTLLRASELARVKWSHIFDDERVLFIPKTKTNKGGQLDYRSLSGTTMRLLHKLQDETDTAATYVFNGLVNTNTIVPADRPLSYKSIVNGLRGAISYAGFDASTYSGHSCRVGAALSMRQQGISLESIMEAGGWKSASTVHRYIQAIEARYSGSAQLARMSGR